ncbi:hypothetical protein LIER_28300 [Lithospermum erythrorhizon]|uniref:Reverse transcriptase n=1 Tax=Lithospermum erythrorhizon TaxID=34254 RepID=A0AAV3RGC5_LITER
MNHQLTRAITSEEVRRVVFEMPVDKSPGPDEELTSMLRAAEERKALSVLSELLYENKDRYEGSYFHDSGNREVRDQGKYPGLPSQIGRTKKEVFRYIAERVEERMRGWKGKLLSQVRKEVLIKSVMSAIPNYVMNYFKLPSGIIDNLNSAMAKFFWGNSDGEKCVHWKKWDSLCADKNDRWLGFKDLECMNIALLAKQGWRVAIRQASLLFKLL